MKVVVIGAGVVGLTTAYELCKDGHEVTVVERHDDAAEETSFGNAGLIAPGHSYTWASPKAPKILLASLFRRDQALRFSPSLDPDLYRWSLKFLRQCTAERARVNTLTKLRLCRYSQERLHAIVADTGIASSWRCGRSASRCSHPMSTRSTRECAARSCRRGSRCLSWAASTSR
jgi:D-amino-acid dehydrogenase